MILYRDTNVSGIRIDPTHMTEKLVDADRSTSFETELVPPTAEDFVHTYGRGNWSKQPRLGDQLSK